MPRAHGARLWLIGCLAVAASVVASSRSVAAQPEQTCANSPATITAAEFTRILAVSPIDQDCLTVEGDIDLSSLATVDHAIRCHHCHLDGALRISGTTFNRFIDLDDIRVDGSISAVGTSFKAPVLVRGDRGPTSGVGGPVNFSLSTFDDAVTFDGLSFQADVLFEGVRFARSVSFVGTDFRGKLNLDRISVGGPFVCSGPGSRDADVPAGVVVGPTLMRDATFRDAVDLSARSFTGGLDASRATFLGSLDLTSSTVGSGLDQPGLVLDHAVVGDLEAQAASFLGQVSVQNTRAAAMEFDRAAATAAFLLNGTRVSGVASFDGTKFNKDLGLEKFSAGRMVLDVDVVGQVASVTARRATLVEIEQTARESGDLSRANDARFKLLATDGHSGSLVRRSLDRFFYEQLAGYLVRPLRPVRGLLLLVLAGTVARYLYDGHRRRKHPDELPASVKHLDMTLVKGKGRRRGVRVGHEITSFLQRFTRALIASLRPKPAIQSPVGKTTMEPYLVAGMRLFEYVASKLLIVLFFLSLGNYNSTLRDVLQAVRL